MSETAGQSGTPESLRQRTWRRFLKAPDGKLVDDLYAPGLRIAWRYDRCCSYFSSTVLAAASRGFGPFIQRVLDMGDQLPKPPIRLVVNEELIAADLQALHESGDTRPLEELLLKRLRKPKELLEKQRLGMLAWLAREGWLEVRVGVMRHGAGIVHAKFGLIRDSNGDAVVFSGSGNESASGLVANYERLEVSSSWDDPERAEEYAQEFEQLWTDTHPDVHIVPLPEAVRLKLIKMAPEEPPVTEPDLAVERQRAAMLWRFITEAPFFPDGDATCDETALVRMWPHQAKVISDVAAAWPDGRLLCDEVGMGKTVEAILILRRLLAGRGVRRALILLPAGLVVQWQGELREKGGLVVPRLEGTTTLVAPDGSVTRVESLAEALRQDVLLMSRETARVENNLNMLLEAEPWDLVLLDESHAARRRAQEEGEFNSGNLLLTLLRRLQLRCRTRGIMLLSATPMQTQPWEPWDLLQVLGEGGAWLADFSGVRTYYQAIRELQGGQCGQKTARETAHIIAADPAYPPLDGVDPRDGAGVARLLSFAPISRRPELAAWLRRGSPLTRRMHRNTRGTLRDYYQRGMLDSPPPARRVLDLEYDFDTQAERDVYNAVSAYIEKRFEELENDKPGKGFVMTIYRRRASSSPEALKRSLGRRRDGLQQVASRRAYDLVLASSDVPEALDADEVPEGSGKVPASLPTDPAIARKELVEVEGLLERLEGLHGHDSKREHFFGVLRRVTDDGRAVLVFTEYTDTMDYLRESVIGHYGNQVGCYSGDGGQVWTGTAWSRVSKERITALVREGDLRLLICTDAASEGLNLQAAGALINYDLPWNPSRVEQRIGRIDRIGQQHAEVLVANIFLANSVDDRVYRALRERCGLFEHFVGSMQPVLARARRMLLGQEHEDLAALIQEAAEVEKDPLAGETYVESPAGAVDAGQPAVTVSDIVEALASLPEIGDVTRRVKGTPPVFSLKVPGQKPVRLAASPAMLDEDESLTPVSPTAPVLRELASYLHRTGEHLPLVTGSYEDGAFRTTVAYWIHGTKAYLVQTMQQLRDLLNAWDGQYADPAKWVGVQRRAVSNARKLVGERVIHATEQEAASRERQIEAVRLRLKRELGRYLVCQTRGDASDLNAVLYGELNKDGAGTRRLRVVFERIGGYPEWDGNLCQELEEWHAGLSEPQRQTRLLGSPLDAALADPRWEMQG